MDSVLTAVPLGDERNRLSEYVSEVERTHQRVTTTRHGRPAAVPISADDLAAIEETLEILGTPGAAEAISEGLADAAAGRFADNDALKSRYGIAWVQERYSIRVTARAERDPQRLPEKMATACVEFIFGPLADNPQEWASRSAVNSAACTLLAEVTTASSTVCLKTRAPWRSCI